MDEVLVALPSTITIPSYPSSGLMLLKCIGCPVCNLDLSADQASYEWIKLSQVVKTEKGLRGQGNRHVRVRVTCREHRPRVSAAALEMLPPCSNDKGG